MHETVLVINLIGVTLEVNDRNIVVSESQGYVEVCVNLTSSISDVMRNVTVNLLIEPGTIVCKCFA